VGLVVIITINARIKQFLIQKNLNCNKKNQLTVGILIVSCMLFRFTGIHAQENSIFWSNPIDMTQTSNSTNALFSAILCDQNQNTHLLWADRFEFSTIYYMNDALGEWSAPIDVIANSDTNYLMIRLSAGISNNNDMLHLLWVDQWIHGRLYYSHVPLSKANDARAWMAPILLTRGTENGSIAIDKDGTLHVVYGTFSSDYLEVGIEYIRSNDGGNSWSSPVQVFSKKVAYPSDPFGRLAVDGEGRLHVGISIRSQDYGQYSEIGYLRSLDGGQTWRDYRLIDDLGKASQGVNVISPYAFGKDEIHLTWHDPRRMHQWSDDGGKTWSEPVEIMELGAAFGGPNALTKDSAGVVHVVTAIRGAVYSAKWDGVMWGPPERIEDREIDPHGQDITICQGNKLQIVYDDRNETQNIWYSSRIGDAPNIAQGSIPIINPGQQSQTKDSANIDQAIDNNETQDIETTTPEATAQLFDNTASTPSNPMTPIIIASTLVILLILVVFIIRQR
jgi:hypothetical protein